MTTKEKLQTFLDHPCECPEDVAELKHYLRDSRYTKDVMSFSDQDVSDLWKQVS